MKEQLREQTITVRQLKSYLGQIIDDVCIGEKIFIVTKYGRPSAKIVPLDNYPPEEAA